MLIDSNIVIWFLIFFSTQGMKNRFILISVLFLSFINLSYSQSTSEIKNSQVKGIYLTLEGFKNNAFSCSIDTFQKNIKVKLNQFFMSSEISCINSDKKTVFYKDSIFAIQLNNGKNFRFINRNPCHIADTSFLYIYTYKTIKTEYKQYGPTRRAKEIPVTYYYFSTGGHKNVYSLTTDNLCRFLSLESDIKVAIKQKFLDDKMLYLTNLKTGRFVLNEFLIELSRKNK